MELQVRELKLFGLDGYDVKTDEQMVEVSAENQYLINSFIQTNTTLKSFTPTNYSNVPTQSIYSFI